MVAQNRIASVLLLICLYNSAILADLGPEFSTCMEELGLNVPYRYDTPEVQFNKTCLSKCIYEKEGKLDHEGQFIPTAFINITYDIKAQCLNISSNTNLCKKVNYVDRCIFHKTEPYMQKYKDCQKYISSTDEPYTGNNCYYRCQMIKDGNLEETGNVNLTKMNYPFINITPSQALENCYKLVSDEDSCDRDPNLYYCVNYVLYHTSINVLEIEFECAKQHKLYPFLGFETYPSRVCYDRCVLIKMGTINEMDFMKSEFMKKLNMNESQIEHAVATCKMALTESDKCTKDVYMFDCVNYIHNSDPEMLKNRKECAQETNSPIIPYRTTHNRRDPCNTRCLMIKEKQLDTNGEVNKINLRKFTVYDKIIHDSISECSIYNINKTCMEDVNAYVCVTSNINSKMRDICKNESMSYNGSEVSITNGICYSRCIMIYSGQITTTGEIKINSLKHLGKPTFSIEKAIQSCIHKFTEKDECERDVITYSCVNYELLNDNSVNDIEEFN